MQLPILQICADSLLMMGCSQKCPFSKQFCLGATTSTLTLLLQVTCSRCKRCFNPNIRDTLHFSSVVMWGCGSDRGKSFFVQTTCGAHPASYLGTWGDFTRGKTSLARTPTTNRVNTLRTTSFKLFKRPFPGFLIIFTL